MSYCPYVPEIIQTRWDRAIAAFPHVVFARAFGEYHDKPLVKLTDDANRWCRDRYGKRATYNSRDFADREQLWTSTVHAFMFKDPDHALEFKLFWG